MKTPRFIKICDQTNQIISLLRLSHSLFIKRSEVKTDDVNKLVIVLSAGHFGPLLSDHFAVTFLE